MVVENLREAGAISIGKLNMHELAYGITSTIPITGRSAIRMTENEFLADPAAVPAQRSRPELSTAQPEAIQADRSEFRLHFAARWGSSRRSVLSAAKDVFRWAHRSTTWDRWPERWRTAALITEAMAGRKFPVKPRTDVRIGMPENFYFDDIDPEIHVAVQHAVERAEKMGRENRARPGTRSRWLNVHSAHNSPL